jgi:hypothetical protein
MDNEEFQRLVLQLQELTGIKDKAANTPLNSIVTNF